MNCVTNHLFDVSCKFVSQLMYIVTTKTYALDKTLFAGHIHGIDEIPVVVQVYVHLQRYIVNLIG